MTEYTLLEVTVSGWLARGKPWVGWEKETPFKAGGVEDEKELQTEEQ